MNNTLALAVIATASWLASSSPASAADNGAATSEDAQVAPRTPRGTSPEPPFPPYLGSFDDPSTGARVTRISGDKGEPIPNTSAKWKGRTFRLPCWALASTFGKGGIIFMVKPGGSGEIRTVCQTWHHDPVNYWAQTQAIPSPTGTRLMLARNWGTGPNYDDGEAQSYVADLRKQP